MSYKITTIPLISIMINIFLLFHINPSHSISSFKIFFFHEFSRFIQLDPLKLHFLYSLYNFVNKSSNSLISTFCITFANKSEFLTILDFFYHFASKSKIFIFSTYFTSKPYLFNICFCTLAPYLLSISFCTLAR